MKSRDTLKFKTILYIATICLLFIYGCSKDNTPNINQTNETKEEIKGSGITVLLYQNHSFQKIVKGQNASYNVESTIPIDSKYHSIYDNGIVIVQLRCPQKNIITWDEDVDFVESNKSFSTDRIDGKNLQKEKLILKGESFGYTESEVKNFKVDIKVVFIPVEKMIELQATGINTNNVNKITDYLKM